MQIAKLFQDGDSQAVRLPDEYRFKGERVYIKRIGNAVILLPFDSDWQSLVDSLALFSSDFMEERFQPPIDGF